MCMLCIEHGFSVDMRNAQKSEIARGIRMIEDDAVVFGLSIKWSVSAMMLIGQQGMLRFRELFCVVIVLYVQKKSVQVRKCGISFLL